MIVVLSLKNKTVIIFCKIAKICNYCRNPKIPDFRPLQNSVIAEFRIFPYLSFRGVIRSNQRQNDTS